MAEVMSKKSSVDSNISIGVQPPPRLTEGQKACLRLVVQHHTSKEIARILGISPFTVDQRLDAARRKLQVKRRKDAAKIFAALEMHPISQSFVYETQPIAPPDFAVSQRASPGRMDPGFANAFLFRAVTPTGGGRQMLSTREIIVRALMIAFYGSLVMAVFVMVLTATFRLFQ